jgi:uncharacterized protein (DUF58 family)
MEAAGHKKRGQAQEPEPLDPFDASFQRRLEALALLSRRVRKGRDRAERKRGRAGEGIELADYRAYVPGDDYRRIDWNAYGRTERLILRLYEQEEDLTVHLLLDCSGSMASGSPQKLLYGKRLCAALAFIALAHLDRVSVHALAESVRASLPAERGRARIFAVFDFLRKQAAEGTTALSAATSSFVARNRERGVAVLVSDLYDPAGVLAAVIALRNARFDTHVIQLVDEGERHPELHGEIQLRDAETGQERRVIVTDALLERYERAYAAYHARIAEQCAERQATLHTIATSLPLEDAVLRVLRRGGLLD